MAPHKTAPLAPLLLALAVLTGGLVRLYAVFQSPFVIHDGGLFYTLARDLQAAGFALPLTTSYNQAAIPFAYPPLVIYLLAALNGLFHLPLPTLLRWLPSALSILTIPCFYLLGRALLGSAEKAGVAAILFALAPQAVGPQIMGGGVTRAAGALFTLLFLYFLYQALHTASFRPAALASLCGALVVLSHPEWTLHALLGGAVFLAFFGRSRSGVSRGLLIALGAAALSGPWWVTVLARHSAAPFLSAASAGQDAQPLALFLATYWTGEILPVLFGLAAIGFVLAFFRRLPFLAVWLALDLLIEPRGALRTDTMELALLAAQAVFEILALLQPRSRRGTVDPLATRPALAFVAGLVVLGLFNSSVVAIRLARYHVLSTSDQQAFAWITSYTPAQSSVLVFAPQDVYMSPVIEWLPALTGRVSLLTTQGREWLSAPARGYAATYALYTALEPCRETGAGQECLAAWTEASGLDVDYLYFTRAYSNAAADPEMEPLAWALAASDGYELVYQSDQVWIFAAVR